MTIKTVRRNEEINNDMDVLHILIQAIAFMTYASPVILILGFTVGVWARKSRRAPRLGMTMIVLCALLFLTISGIVAYYAINPPGYSDPGINALEPWIMLCFLAGPQSLIAGILLLITTIILIRSLIKRNSEPAGGAYGAPVTLRRFFAMKIRPRWTTDRKGAP